MLEKNILEGLNGQCLVQLPIMVICEKTNRTKGMLYVSDIKVKVKVSV